MSVYQAFLLFWGWTVKISTLSTFVSNNKSRYNSLANRHPYLELPDNDSDYATIKVIKFEKIKYWLSSKYLYKKVKKYTILN